MPNRWLNPTPREKATKIVEFSSSSTEFPDANANTYSSTNAFADKNIKKQVRKKKPKKKKKEDRIRDND